MSDPNCPYCSGPGGDLVWSDARCRVVHIADTPFAGLCRVVWAEHVKEFSDLGAADREHLMVVVAETEQAIRTLLQPAKMNLAALGTQVPHLHWHVVPRYEDDTHYPDPMWATARRPDSGRKTPQDFPVLLGKVLAERLGVGPGA